MAKTHSRASVRIILQDGDPYLESRLRSGDDAAGRPIPPGQILVLRTPLLTAAMIEAATESELIDDDTFGDDAFCPECAMARDEIEEMTLEPLVVPPEILMDRLENSARNDPCPCGSGKTYKRCCLDCAVPRPWLSRMPRE